MSFILDALKKSESDRQRQNGPALYEVKVATPRTQLPLWAIGLAVLLAINLGVVAWALLRRSSEPAVRAQNSSSPPGGTRQPAGPGQAPLATLPPQGGAAAGGGGYGAGTQGQSSPPGPGPGPGYYYGQNGAPPGGYGQNDPRAGAQPGGYAPNGNGGQRGAYGPNDAGPPGAYGPNNTGAADAYGAGGGYGAGTGYPQGSYPPGSGSLSQGGNGGLGGYGSGTPNPGTHGPAQGANGGFAAGPSGGGGQSPPPASGQQQGAPNADDYAPAKDPAPPMANGFHARRGLEGGMQLYSDAVGTNGLPELKLDLLTYSENPRERFVLINMKTLHEGDMAAQGIRVDSITSDGVILNRNGIKYLLSPR